MPIVQPCRWLDDLSAPHAELRRALVRRAHADIGVEENATNRSPYIDDVMRACGSPLGSPWCGGLAYRWAGDVGAWRPVRDAGGVRYWVHYAKERGIWHPVDSGYDPIPGDFIAYDFKPDGIGDHLDVLAREHARGARSIGGNTSWGGDSRDGTACVMKPTSMKLILGYIECVPAAA